LASVKLWHDLIARQFPELSPITVVDLGEGCDSVAVEVNGRFVFRFPKRADVEEQIAIETRILPALARTSPLPIPVFQFFGKTTIDWPRRFVGYPKLPGRPAIQVEAATASPRPLAPAIGRFLSWLHAYPVADAEALGVPRQSIDAVIEEVRRDALDDLGLLAAIAPHVAVDEIARALNGTPPRATSAPVLVHNDFAAEHLLADDEGTRATGVIDWSDIAISDAAVDFAGLYHWGGAPFADAVMAAYDGRLDDGARARARFMAMCRGVMDVRFGREFDRPEYIRGGLRALQYVAESTGSGRT
jgi:aminoglycoside phosphotransferase (APT) family kinase protein